MHRIKRNHGNEHPRKLVFVDSEAYSVADSHMPNAKRLSLRLACAQMVRHEGTSYRIDEMHTFHSQREWWQWLNSIGTGKTVTWVFAHNLWFDMSLLGFREKLSDGTITSPFATKVRRRQTTTRQSQLRRGEGAISLERHAAFAITKTDGHRVNYVDSLNYYHASLSDIGKEIGLPKLDLPHETQDEADWVDYCKRDVSILREAICQLIREWKMHSLGNWKLTAPSLAMSCYLHRFYDYPIVHHDIRDLREDESYAYVGGETSVFYHGQITSLAVDLFQSKQTFVRESTPHIMAPIYKLDCNSLYPFVMRQRDYPCQYVGTMQQPVVERVSEELKQRECVANVEITSDTITLPVRFRSGVWYATGRFWTWLCGDELRLALANGLVRRVARCHVYDSAPLFKKWVDFWYQAKLDATAKEWPVRREFCKMMLNSLSGKWAQQDKRWLTDTTSNPIMEWGGWARINAQTKVIENFRSLGKLVQRQAPKGYADHTLIPISACITANARAYMSTLRRSLPMRSVLYQDTDSLWVTQHAMDHLTAGGWINATEIGKFKHEDTIFDGGIYGRKDYIANGVFRKAGVSRSAKWDGRRSWICELFEDGDSMFSRRPDGTVIVRTIRIAGSELSCGRKLNPDGWTDPVRFDELEKLA
jgi:DNA polymerase type B, organellar and viral